MILDAKELYQIAHKYNEEYVNSFKRVYLEKYLEHTKAENILRATAQVGQTFTTFCLTNELVQLYGRDLIKEMRLLTEYFESYGYRVQTSIKPERDELTCNLRVYIKFTLSWGNRI